MLITTPYCTKGIEKYSTMINATAAYLFSNTSVVEDLKQLRTKRSAQFVSTAADCMLQARKECDLALMAEIFFEECVYHNHVTSQYKLSNIMASKCLGIASKLKLPKLQANALRMIGMNYNFLGEFIKASDAFNQGIQILENTDDIWDEEKGILAGLYFNLVTLYRDFELDDSKLKCIDKAFQLFSEINDQQGIARTYLLYANFYPGIKGTKKVVEYFEKAAAIFKEIGDQRGLGNSLVNLGNHFCGKKNFKKGMPILIEGIECVKKSGSTVYIMNGIFNLAIAFRKQKKYKEAIKTFKEVEKLMIQSESGINLTSLYSEWSTTLEEAGDHGGALDLYKKYHEQKEHVNKFDKTSAVNNTKMFYELEVQKREAETLRKKNVEIEAYARKIEVSNFELMQFAHVASHDLKEPLHMVSSYMQLLEKRITNKLTDEEKEFLNYAKDGAKRMYGLIDSLLKLSKISNETSKESVDLNDTLEDVTNLLHLEMERKNFRVIHSKLPVITANKTHMQQLLQNLISNAMKYNQSKEPMVEISYLASNSQHYFGFSDNGIGIQEQHHSKVFEIFQRLHGREEYPGTGIGLTICKKIVDQLGGKMWIETSKYNGSNFKFTIPV